MAEAAVDLAAETEGSGTSALQRGFTMACCNAVEYDHADGFSKRREAGLVRSGRPGGHRSGHGRRCRRVGKHDHR